MKGLSMTMSAIVSVVVFVIAVILVYRFWKSDPVPTYEGTYIRFSQNEFGNAWDTLVIKEEEHVRNRFSILQKWRYERTLDGKVIQPEYTRNVTTGQWMEKEGLLVEDESGVRYFLDEKKKKLAVGELQYLKIN